MRVNSRVTPDGAAVVEARKAAGFKSQAEMARFMCVEPPVLCWIEKGRPTRPMTLMAIAYLTRTKDWRKFVAPDAVEDAGGEEEAAAVLPEAA